MATAQAILLDRAQRTAWTTSFSRIPRDVADYLTMAKKSILVAGHGLAVNARVLEFFEHYSVS